MPRSHPLKERHRTDRVGWLRASVLGANDGILSVSSLIVGVASANPDRTGILLAGLSATVAGAMSMAAGEYVSVSSQADTEAADTEIERQELAEDPAGELDELTAIYLQRGLEPDLARQVAVQLSEKGALKAHLRDELGITEVFIARPLQAALASASSFLIGAFLPMLVAALVPAAWIVLSVGMATVASLAFLGGISAWLGGAKPLPGVIRICFWGIVAMGMTSVIGWLFGGGAE